MEAELSKPLRCFTWNIIWDNDNAEKQSQKYRLLVDNTVNQDTEKVFQTVSVASVERTALAAATEDHVWAKASSVRMAAKKRACRTESETCQGNLFLKSWERTFYWAYVLMWVKFYYYPLIEIDFLKFFDINMTYQNKKARSARTRCSTCKFRAQMRRQSHELGCASNKCLMASASSELAMELPLRFEPDLLSVLKLYTGGSWIV